MKAKIEIIGKIQVDHGSILSHVSPPSVALHTRFEIENPAAIKRRKKRTQLGPESILYNVSIETFSKDYKVNLDMT